MLYQIYEFYIQKYTREWDVSIIIYDFLLLVLLWGQYNSKATAPWIIAIKFSNLRLLMHIIYNSQTYNHTPMQYNVLDILVIQIVLILVMFDLNKDL